MPTTTQAVLLGLLILFVAFLFPMLISAPDSGIAIHQTTLEGPGDDEILDDALRINLDNKTTETASLNVTSLETGETDDLTLTQTETQSVTLDNQTVTITALDIEPAATGDVVLEVRYPSDFAWSNNASALSDNLPIVLAAVAFLVVMALLAAVIRS